MGAVVRVPGVMVWFGSVLFVSVRFGYNSLGRRYAEQVFMVRVPKVLRKLLLYKLGSM